MEIGIIGLPNVGKTSLLNALTSAQAHCANFPFTTIEPNSAVAIIEDPQLEIIAKIIKSKTIQYAPIKFTDVAGLIKGAARGEGLGNLFLSHVRPCNALIEVIRLFENKQIISTQGEVDPIRDIEIIESELILSDIEHALHLQEKASSPSKKGEKYDAQRVELLTQSLVLLNEGKMLNQNKELSKELVNLDFLTTKPIMIVANVNHKTDPQLLNKLIEWADHNKQKVIKINVEDQLSVKQLDKTQKEEFRQELGLGNPLKLIIEESFKMLNLIVFFTANNKQATAWPIAKGSTAYQGAGLVHSDFQSGFIRAQVCKVENLVKYGSLSAVKKAGLLQTVGRDYQIQHGDILEFLVSQ